MINKNHFDAIVLGVGSMGSAACFYLARNGCRVLGLEQFQIPHQKGSHHGQSRIIRKAYFEHPDYVPLLKRAYYLWKELENITGEQLYFETGILYMGPGNSEVIKGVRTSSELFQVPIQSLSHEYVRNEYPVFEIPNEFEILLEPGAGFLRPEKSVELYTKQARKTGAIIRENEKVRSWELSENRIRIITSSGEYTSDKLIITAGAWMPEWIRPFNQLVVTKQILAWMDIPEESEFGYGQLPCWFIEAPGKGTYYGFPVLPHGDFGDPRGFKFALHYHGQIIEPDHPGKDIPAGVVEDLRFLLSKYIPPANVDINTLLHCFYTNTPDTHFIIDFLPGYDKKIVVAGGFSGHGFKFSSVVGEILSDLATKESSALPIGFLGLDRF